MRLLLAPDRRPTLARLQALLGPGDPCDIAETAEEALLLMRDGDYLAALVDCAGPGGAALIHALRDAGCDLPVVAVCPGATPDQRVRLLDLGADDVVAEGCAGVELAARLRAVARRRHGFARSALAHGPLVLDLAACSLSVGGQAVPVGRQEFTLLRLLFLRRGAVLSRAVLSAHLYPDGEEPESRTLEVLVCKLRKKLAVHGADWAVATVRGVGYRLGEKPPQGALVRAA